MEELKIVIPGEPCAQGRPRFSTKGGFVKAYDPEKSRNYKAYIKYIASQEVKNKGWQITDQAIEVSITAYMTIPKSKPKKFKMAALDGNLRPTKKPDVDNLFKAVTDALSGIAYVDDKQIVEATQSKWYAKEPRIEVSIRVLA